MEITVALRENLGTRNGRRSRGKGEIPGVVYGEGKPTEHIAVSARDFNRLMKEGPGKLIELKIQKGKRAEKSQVLIKDTQHHPVKGNVLHVDFLRVNMDRPVTVKVPISLANDEKKTREGAIIEFLLHELEVSCLPGDIPERILLEAADLPTGGKILVKDLELSEAVNVITSLDEIIVQAVAPTVAVEPETAEESDVTEPEAANEKKEEA